MKRDVRILLLGEGKGGQRGRGAGAAGPGRAAPPEALAPGAAVPAVLRPVSAVSRRGAGLRWALRRRAGNGR